MKYLKLVLFVVFILVASIGACDSLKQVTKGLAAKYKAMDAAYRSENLKTIGDMFDDGCKFKMKGEGQSLNKPLFLKGTAALFKMRDVKKSETKLDSVKVAKDGEYLAVSHWYGETTESPKGKTFKGTNQTIYDTWKKTKGGWVIVNRLIEQ